MNTIKNIEELIALADAGKKIEAKMTILPDDARAILEKFTLKQKYIFQAVVKKYTGIMRKGEWECEETSIPICFKRGRFLYDGMQRLYAVLFYGNSVTFNVQVIEDSGREPNYD